MKVSLYIRFAFDETNIETIVSQTKLFETNISQLKQIDSNQVAAVLNWFVPKKGKTKSDVARKLGISSQLLGQYMDGKKKPKTDFYVKWKSVFGEDLLSVIETNVSEGAANKNEELLIVQDQVKFRALIIERLTQLEANIRALNSTVIELKHRVTGDSTTKIALELEQTSRQVADMIYDELKKIL